MLGRQHALQELAFADVSAGDVAQAMLADRFFSDYGEKILVVHGTVVDVHAIGHRSAVALATDIPFGLTCTVAAPTGGALPAAGSVITVVAPGGTAQRQPSSVDLPECRIMSVAFDLPDVDDVSATGRH
jgi:hypothetical protein